MSNVEPLLTRVVPRGLAAVRRATAVWVQNIVVLSTASLAMAHATQVRSDDALIYVGAGAVCGIA